MTDYDENDYEDDYEDNYANNGKRDVGICFFYVKDFETKQDEAISIKDTVFAIPYNVIEKGLAMSIQKDEEIYVCLSDRRKRWLYSTTIPDCDHGVVKIKDGAVVSHSIMSTLAL